MDDSENYFYVPDNDTHKATTIIIITITITIIIIDESENVSYVPDNDSHKATTQRCHLDRSHRVAPCSVGSGGQDVREDSFFL